MPLYARFVCALSSPLHYAYHINLGRGNRTRYLVPKSTGDTGEDMGTELSGTLINDVESAYCTCKVRSKDLITYDSILRADFSLYFIETREMLSVGWPWTLTYRTYRQNLWDAATPDDLAENPSAL